VWLLQSQKQVRIERLAATLQLPILQSSRRRHIQQFLQIKGEHPDFASMQKYDKIYPFVGKPTLSFPKKSVLESMSHFIAIEEGRASKNCGVESQVVPSPSAIC